MAGSFVLLARQRGFCGEYTLVPGAAQPLQGAASRPRYAFYAALFPHSLREAISAPSRSDFSFSHTTGSTTHSRLVKVPKPQSVDAITRSRSPTAATASSIRARHDFRMLDEIAGGFDHAGQQHHMRGQRMFLERGIFMRMARIGELNGQRADIRGVERRQNLLQRDVVDMRAFPVAVTDMQPHALARNAFDPFIDGGDLLLALLGEFRVGEIAMEHASGPSRDRARRSAE